MWVWVSFMLCEVCYMHLQQPCGASKLCTCSTLPKAASACRPMSPLDHCGSAACSSGLLGLSLVCGACTALMWSLGSGHPARYWGVVLLSGWLVAGVCGCASLVCCVQQQQVCVRARSRTCLCSRGPRPECWPYTCMLLVHVRHVGL